MMRALDLGKKIFWEKQDYQTENRRILRLPDLELVKWLLLRSY